MKNSKLWLKELVLIGFLLGALGCANKKSTPTGTGMASTTPTYDSSASMAVSSEDSVMRDNSRTRSARTDAMSTGTMTRASRVSSNTNNVVNSGDRLPASVSGATIETPLARTAPLQPGVATEDRAGRGMGKYIWLGVLALAIIFAVAATRKSRRHSPRSE